MNNFPITYNGQVYWYSRSVTAGIFVFAYSKSDKSWYILANKRGTGCPNAAGLWNVPGGFIDFDETTKQGAIRECKEETGVIIPESLVHLHGIVDKPKGEKQNITFRYYAILPKDPECYTFNYNLMEPDEVEEIKWIQVKNLSDYKWAFNHYNNIMNIYNTTINISLIKKIKRYIVKKLNGTFLY